MTGEKKMDDEYIVDLGGAGTEEEVQERLMESLPLPDYYGGNLDALYDVLTEMGDGWHIIILNADDVDDEVRQYVEDMKNVFEDASAVAGDMSVEYELETYDDDDDEIE